MPKMVQLMLSVTQPELDRLDALRVVMGVSRSEVQRQANRTPGGLQALEMSSVLRLQRLLEVAKANGHGRLEDYVRALVAGRQKVPTLEELEQGISA